MKTHKTGINARLLLGVAVLVMLGGCQKGPQGRLTSPQDEARVIVEKGWALEQQGQLDAALAEYDRALTVDPQCFVAYKHRGTTMTRKGAFDQALKAFDKAIEFGDTHASTYYNRGLLHYDMGNFDLALADYSKAIELQPDYFNALGNRAGLYARRGDYDKASADYTRLLELQPKRADVYAARGSVRMSQKKYDEALADFDRSLMENPRDVKVLLARAALRIVRNDLPQALEDYRRVVALDPQRAEAYVYQTMIYDQTGEEALADTIALALKAVDLKAYKKLALSRAWRVLRQEGRSQDGLARFSALIDEDPQDPEFYYQRALARLFLKDYGGAVADDTRVLELRPGEAKTLNSRGMVYAEWGRAEEALADFSQAIALDPSYINAYFNRAGVYLGKRDYDKSWADIVKIRELGGPVMPEFLHKLETASGRTDFPLPAPDTSDAPPGLDEQLQALEKDPGNYALYLKVAGLYVAQGRGDRALFYARKAQELDGEAAAKDGVHTALALAYYYAGNVKKSYEETEQALAMNPEDSFMKGFKSMLDSVIQRSFHGEKPEGGIWGGYASSYDYMKAVQGRGKGRLGENGAPDAVQWAQITLTMTPPSGWSHQANVTLSSSTSALLLYEKHPGSPFPSISVTSDKLPAGMTLMDYTRSMAERFRRVYEQKAEKALEVVGPREETLQNRPSVFMELTFQDERRRMRQAWYQTLVADRVVTFQYTNTAYQFQEDVPLFQTFLESVRGWPGQP